ncbi:MAG: hypothetical protein ACR2PF_00255 [Rhizobiaceae bacterium]
MSTFQHCYTITPGGTTGNRLGGEMLVESPRDSVPDISMFTVGERVTFPNNDSIDFTYIGHLLTGSCS